MLRCLRHVVRIGEPLRAVGEQISELKFAESCQRQIEAATPSCLPLHACRKMRDLSFGMGPGIFRIRDQPVDRPALAGPGFSIATKGGGIGWIRPLRRITRIA